MKARILNYRTYRGRCTGVESKIVTVEFVKNQPIDHTVLVRLPGGVFGFPEGHLLAISKNQIVES